MPIAVDGSSPARFTGTPNDNVDITSASFTPPANSLLVVCVNADTGGTGGITITVSDSQGLTWTADVSRDGGEGGAQQGHASIWTAEVETSTSMTVSVRRNANGGTNRISAKPYVVTGFDSADPVGAVGEGSSTSTSNTPNAYTSTANNSRGFGCATDWAQNGNLTSSDVEDFASYAGAIDVISLHKAADTPTSGSTVTINFVTDGGASSAWNWVAIEIKPAAGGATINADARISAGSRQTGESAVARVTNSRLDMRSGARGATAVSKVAQAVIAARSGLSGLASVAGIVLAEARLAFRSSFRGLGAAARVAATRIAARSGLTGRFFQDTTPIAARVSVALVTQAKLSDQLVTRAMLSDQLVTRAKVSDALVTRATVSDRAVTRAKITVELGG